MTDHDIVHEADVSETPDVTPGDFDIAIIGMAGRFPGAADLDAFWENLVNGVESVRDFTEEEVLAAGIDPVLAQDPHYVKRGGVLDGAELFDAGFFGFYPREAEIMDPQHRVFLEVAWHALEHAGYDPAAYAGTIGLYAGCGMNSYLLFNLARNREIMETVQGYQLSLANDKDYLPTRVSYKLNLRGPSVNVQTACSTSLVAIHLACRALLNFECDMALAGGITIRLPQTGGYLYQEGGITSPDGHCRPFDADAAGTVGGNGVGVVVLKRLADAIADDDTIHAVIKATAINNDGASKVGYTAPSVEGQAQVIANALDLAGVDPRTVTYIETHGTGTALGDPIEITALTQVFGAQTDDRQFCAIGSVKANVGHLDAAAGVVGLIKTVLALKHKQIPPSINFTQPNPRIRFEETPFYVNTKLCNWQTDEPPRRAGVSSFGIGGTNVHAVLEEAPPLGSSEPARPWHLFLLSAKSEEALERATANLRHFLARASEQSTAAPSWLADVAYTSQVGRQPFAHRRAVVARTAEEAVAALTGQVPEQVATGTGEPDARSIAFMFSGQGSQYANMGRDLYRREPVFRRWVDACAELLRPHLGLDLRTLLFPPASAEADAEEQLRRTAFTQPALFTIEYALAQLWMSWGITPDAMIGHSIGEYVAACLAGVMSLPDALAVVATRGRLMGLLPAGAMLSLALDEVETRSLLSSRPDLTIAAVNAPGMCVVSGPHEAIAALAEELEERGISARRLHTSHAFHSAMMDPILTPFTEAIYRVRLQPPQIPYLSNVTGTWITAGQATDPAYYAQHLRSTVRFADGIATLAAEPGRILLEVGPGRALASLAKTHPAVGRERAVLTSLRHPQERQDDQAFVLLALGQLWLAGIRPNWTSFHEGERRRRVPLPAYPFERRRYWVDPTPGFEGPPRTAPRKEREITRWFYLPSWRRAPLALKGRSEGERLQQVLLLLPGPEATLAMGTLRSSLYDAIVSRLDGAIVAMPGSRFARLNGDGASRASVVAAYTIRPDAAEDYDSLFAGLARQGTFPKTVLHLLSLESPADFETAQARGFDSLIALAQAWSHRGQGTPLRIVIGTTGLWEITGEEPLRPAIAPLIGAARVIPQEHPDISCRIVDLAHDQSESQAEILMREMLADTTEPVVAYRGRYRWAQDFLPAETALDAGRSRLRDHGVYLITGGLGRIGGVLAEHLVRTCGARLALVDRAKLPAPDEWDNWLVGHPPDDPVSRKIAQIRQLEGAGAEVLVLTADVADREEMAAAVTRAATHFGALHGVIHAAGTVGAAAIRAVTETDASVREMQFRPKVNGTLALAQALTGQELDFVVLMSSVSTVLGGLGFAAYAAANCFMDAFAVQQARQRDEARQRWFSVAWDGWRFGEETALAGWTAALDFAITADEGADAFVRALALADEPQVIIATGDLHSRLAQWTRPPGQRTAPAPEKGTAATPSRQARPKVRTAYVPPTDDIERAIVADWEKTLGIAPIGIHDDFFELGGHSLLATQLISRLRDAYRVELPLRNLFETPSVAGLAAVIRTRLDQAPAAKETPPPTATIARIPRPPDGIARTPDELPLSFGQQRLWFLDQLDPGSPLYNNFAALRVTGDLDPVRLERSLNAVIARHEVLRTTFANQDGRPIQAILPSLKTSIPVDDLRDLPPTAQEGEIMRLAVEEARAAFDLARGPLLRCRLLRTADQDHVLFFTMHHIVSDGWSVGVLIREVAALYQALDQAQSETEIEAVLPRLPIQYVDYAAWQREWLSGEAREAELAFWHAQLSPEPPPLELPTDRPRPAIQTFRGGNVWFEWPPELQQRLEALAQSEGVTLFMALLAGLQTLCFRYTHQEDFCIGTPVANRDRPETAGLIGFLLNTLVLRADLSGKPTFRALLARVREAALKAYAHQELPFEMLVEALQPTRDMSRSPFFQVMFDLQEAPLQSLALPGVSLQPLRIDGGTAKFDLALSMEYGPTGLSGYLNYNSDLFDGDTARRMLDHLRTLLEAAIADPDQQITTLPILTEEEQGLILGQWSMAPVATVETRPVAALFAAQVALRPEQEALIMADGSGICLSYAELDRRAGQLAGYLHSLDLEREDIVALLLERSADMIVAVLGALKAGVAFLPIDPSTPPERIGFMLADAGTRAVLTQGQVLETYGHKPDIGPVICLDTDWAEIKQSPTLPVKPDDATLHSLAYVIYTSGSTGLPKGVMIEQGELAAHLRVVADRFGLTSNDRVLQFSAYTFDQGLEQILATLISGGTLVVRGPEIWPPADFLRILHEYNLTVINLPPAYWEQVLQTWVQADVHDMDSSLRTVISGGDVLTPQCLRLWQETRARHVRLLNAYGPTEATITATTFDVPADWFRQSTRPVPIGSPLPGRCAFIVDPHGNPVPAGVPGELLLGGIGLSRGYLRRPDLTAERFVPNPFTNRELQIVDCESGDAPTTIRNPKSEIRNAVRLYRTGDLARWRTDGLIEFLGRVDRQVKVRGFRVELGEIEAVLHQHPAIRQAAVVLHGPENDRRIIAYLAVDRDARPAPGELRTFMAQKLPSYMVPSAFVALDTLPVTSSGKIDRRRLPDPDSTEQLQAETAFLAPRTPVEAQVAAIWAEVLKVPRVGVHDNFFDLGGHSLLATQILARLHERYPVTLPLRRLFETPTVAGLAALIEEELLAQQDQEELEALLKELEELSDDEARDLLTRT